MNSLSLRSVAAVSLALLCSPASAVVVNVINLGPVLNDSVSLPNTSTTKTAGAGESFWDYYEFTLPRAEFVSASMSISGPTVDQILTGEGELILSTWTSTGASSPFIPAGTPIQKAIVSPPADGGQDAVVGTFTASGDWEKAGSYFVEVTGVSGGGSLKLAIDGNVTAVPAPELSTWAMLGISFAGVGFARFLTSRKTAAAVA
jgi:hypothetical protein